YALASSGYEIAAADFNEDGIQDLAVATTNDLCVLLGLGSGGHGLGTFGAAAHYVTGSSPRGIALGGFNDDGRPGIAVAGQGVGTISIFLANGSGAVGNGTFASAANFSGGSSARGIVAADFNADGVTDLAVTHFRTAHSDITIFAGDGSGGHGDGTFDLGTD